MTNLSTILGLMCCMLVTAVLPSRTDAKETRKPRSTKRKSVTAEDNLSEKGTKLGREQVVQLRIGFRITAGGPCRGIHATSPIPMDWREQKVRIVDEDFSKAVTNVEYRILEHGVKQLVVKIPRLKAGEKADALVTVEVRGHAIAPAADPTIFTQPKKLTKPFRKFLGASPLIESRNRKIQTTARDILKDKETTWESVEAIYDFVQAKVEYRESKLKGAVQTLKDEVGDCESMTGLFVALCRAAKIPARVVWVTDHCYPEFYLVDDEGKGHWFPCEVAGDKAFGHMPNIRPIIQKGDNIRVPEKKKGQRYVAALLEAKSVKGKPPRIEEVMEFVTK